MKIKFATPNSKKNNEVLVFFLDKSLNYSENLRQLDQENNGAISKVIKSEGFKGEYGEILPLNYINNSDLSSVIIVGLGKLEDLTNLKIENLGGKVYQASKKRNIGIICDNNQLAENFAATFAYGLRLRSYSFDKYKTKKKEEKPFEKVTIYHIAAENSDKYFTHLNAIIEGVYEARNVISEPGNVLYPKSYAKIIKDKLEPLKCEVKILDQDEMKKLGMGALLGVAQGSVREPRLVVIKYQGNKNSKKFPLALVGKGVTFDTGGISLKPALNMEDMKYDMGGSAAVFGTLYTLAKRKAKVNVVGLVGLVENMPDGAAQRPGDIVTSMSGQTIEVLNTDAEGRLVLSDVLTYAQKNFKPEYIVDLATLTGAIVISLGDIYAGLFSNNDEISDKLNQAGIDTGERVWRFPLDEAYDKMIDSKVADMQNISNGRGAGSITAAHFLKRFVEDDVKWAHLDIAGVAWAKASRDNMPEGATGFGVKLLDKFVSENFEKQS